jgi:hypothetical protein
LSCCVMLPSRISCWSARDIRWLCDSSSNTEHSAAHFERNLNTAGAGHVSKTCISCHLCSIRHHSNRHNSLTDC